MNNIEGTVCCDEGGGPSPEVRAFVPSGERPALLWLTIKWRTSSSDLILLKQESSLHPNNISSAMKKTIFTFLSASFVVPLASAVPLSSNSLSTTLNPRASCENTATSRSCWGEYSVDTDYYSVTPDTGVTRGKFRALCRYFHERYIDFLIFFRILVVS